MSNDCAACETKLANGQKPGKDQLYSFISGRMDSCLNRALAEKDANATQVNIDAVKAKTDIMNTYGTLFENGSTDKDMIHDQCGKMASDMQRFCAITMMSNVFVSWNENLNRQ